MWEILAERKKRPFDSFADISNRVRGLYHPEKVIAKRIEDELKDEHAKYMFFAK
jgi:putative nucleotide binding protein